MKTRIYTWPILWTVLIVRVGYSQSNVRLWTETTVRDFSDNELTDLVVTNDSGGEVQLPHPLVKTAEDSNNQSLQRFISRDSVGNYVWAFIQRTDVFVKKYSFEGRELSSSIRVNDTEGTVVTNDNNGYCNVALMKDGTFMVIWEGVTGERHNIYGQLFKDDSLRVGSNFIVKAITDQYEQDGRAIYGASIMAADFDNTFWVFYPMGKSGGFKIYVQRVDKSRSKVGEAFLLNKESLVAYELAVSVAACRDFFWAAWDGANGTSSSDVDVYLRRFKYDGSPLGEAVVVNDEVERGQGGADLCTDDNSNLLVAWIDERDAVEPITSGQFNVYGQLFTPDGNRIGKNIRLNSFGTRSGNRWVDVGFTGKEFQLSWIYWDELNRRDLVYTNKWKFDPKFSGQMISSVFDCGPAGSGFQNITWDETPNPKSEIGFKLRTAKTLTALGKSHWYGPTDTSSYYRNASDSTIPLVHNGDRYVQYEALFTSEDGNSAVLNAVHIGFVSYDTIPPAMPRNFEAAASYSSVILRWEPNNESDLFGYVIYKGTKSRQYDDAMRIIVPRNNASFKDDSVRSGTVYYYAIAAVDSNHNESKLSDEVFSAPSAINVHVSVNAAAGGDGSSTHPFQTIQQAMNAAHFGDTIRVSPGTYSDAFTTRDGVSLVGVSAQECKVNTPIVASDNCLIKGFTITKSLSCDRVSPIITENIFLGTSDEWFPSVNLGYSSSATITKNFITECSMGIGTNYLSNPVIKNNIIKAYGVGIRLMSDGKPMIVNNTVIGQNGAAMQLLSLGTVTIENNILISNANPDVYSPTEYRLLYNDFWGSSGQGVTLPPTNIFLDPKFLNTNLEDYHLSSSSPCVNAGNPDPAFNDIDGTRNDMGAYGGPDPMRIGASTQLTRSLYVSSVSGYPGDTVTVFVGMDNPAGLSKADFVLVYVSPLLHFSSAECIETTKQFTLTYQPISSTQIRFSLSSNTAAQSGKNEILKVRLAVEKAAKTGDASPLMLRNISFFDGNLTEINLRSVTDGAFVVNPVDVSEHYIHVDKNNTGIEDGSREHPFNTITEAIGKAGAGDSILVSGGTYNESIAMKSGIHLIGAGASVTSIDASDPIALATISFDHVDNAEVSGFTIQTSFPSRSLISCVSSSAVFRRNRLEGGTGLLYGIACDENSSVTVESNFMNKAPITVQKSKASINNNVFEALMVMSPIYCGENATVEIHNNTIHGTFASPAIRIMNNSDAFLRNNIIYCKDAGWGVYIIESKHSKVFNNVIIDESRTGTGIRIVNATECEIINNSIVTRGNGIEETGSGNTVMNNIIVNNNNFGVSLSSSDCNYNDVWNNFVNYSLTTPGTNDISLDPLFVDTAKGDYRLSERSPCRNAGNPNVQYNDIDGSRNDIGAYGGPYADSLWKYANGSSLAIDSVAALSLDTVQVLINGKGMSGIVGIDLTLSYDPSLITFSNANVDGLTRSFSLEKTKLKSGSICLSLKGNKGITEEDGKLVELQLVANASKTVNTLLCFDSAAVTDEATCRRSILNLKDGQMKIIAGVDAADKRIPTGCFLFQNYPNPFNPTTHFRFSISRLSIVKLQIYDILGREVATIVSEKLAPGTYTRQWDAANMSSGIYFYRLQARPKDGGQAGSFVETKKLVLLR